MLRCAGPAENDILYNFLHVVHIVETDPAITTTASNQVSYHLKRGYSVFGSHNAAAESNCKSLAVNVHGCDCTKTLAAAAKFDVMT